MCRYHWYVPVIISFIPQATGLQLWRNGNWRIGKTNDYYYLCDDACAVGGSWCVADRRANPAAVIKAYAQALYSTLVITTDQSR